MGRRATAAVVTAGMLALSGCGFLGDAPSPRTSYTGDAGETVTVDWADYPAHAGHDGDAVAEHPDQAGIEPGARALLADIAAALAADTGIVLEPVEVEDDWFGGDDWHPMLGNGYGGESLLTTVNCCELASERIPAPQRWQDALDAASRAATAAGLGAFERDPFEPCDDGDPCWLWSATAYDGVQWVALSIQDTSLDPSGEAAREAAEFGGPQRGISVSYGATVVRAGEAAAYESALAPFAGLDRPDATTSD